MRKTIVSCVMVLTLVVGLVGALALLSATPAFAVGGGCICPMIYAPVLCSNGRTYSNACVASCAHATGCVPIGPGPIEL